MRSVPGKLQSESATPSGGLGEATLRQITGYQLAQATVVTSEIFERIVGGPFDLRPVDYTILMLVKENPGTAPAQLADALAMTRPNISVRVDILEGRGLVVRKRNQSDRRGQHLHATKAGAALGAKVTALLRDNEQTAFAGLSYAEQLMLTELLHKLACGRKQRSADPSVPDTE